MIRHLPGLLVGALALAGCGLINAFSEGEVSFDGGGTGGSNDCALEECFCIGDDCRCDAAEGLCHCEGDCVVDASGVSDLTCSGNCACNFDGCACLDDSCIASNATESCDTPNCSCTVDGCFVEG